MTTKADSQDPSFTTVLPDMSIRDILLRIQEVSIPAINQPSARTQLLRLWRIIQHMVLRDKLNEGEKSLIAEFSRSHDVMAQHMLRAEQTLGSILKEVEDQVSSSKRSLVSLSKTTVDLEGDTSLDTAGNLCPLRAWMYRNVLFPFPSMPDRRKLQSQTNMPLSNINGWFSNIRRRCGWNTLCTKWAQGDRLRMRELMIGCFKGQVTDEGLIKEVVDVIDYVLGKTRGTVGSWLTEIVGEEAPSLSRYTGIKLDFEPARPMHAAPAPSKRRKISHSAKQPQPIIRVQDDLSDDDDDEDWEDDNEPALLEVDPEQNPYVRKLAPMQQFHIGSFPQGVVPHPYRSFSGSSDGSTISNISSQIHSRVPSVDYSQISGSQYTSSPINNGQQNILPVLFGGPTQAYPFQPELPAIETSRRPKRGVQQMEGEEMDTRAYKYARFD